MTGLRAGEGTPHLAPARPLRRHRSVSAWYPMEVIGVISPAPGCGVTLKAADLLLCAQAAGDRVLAIDTSPTRDLARDLEPHGFEHLGDVRDLVTPWCARKWRNRSYPRAGILSLPEQARGGPSLSDLAGTYRDRRNRTQQRWNAWLGHYYDLAVIDLGCSDAAIFRMLCPAESQVRVLLAPEAADPCLHVDWIDRAGLLLKVLVCPEMVSFEPPLSDTLPGAVDRLAQRWRQSAG